MSDMGIYKITNTANDKIYIGQSTRLSKRLNEHRKALKNNYHKNQHLQNAYNKYGDVFKIEIIVLCDDELELDNLERYYIAYYDSMNPAKGYNKESGGNLNKHPSEETRKKMSEAHKDKILLEKEKKKLSKVNNTTGFYRVTKYKDSRKKQGFTWVYNYYQDRKQIQIYSINLYKLKERVLSKNLEWEIIDEENAKQSLELNKKYHKS